MDFIFTLIVAVVAFGAGAYVAHKFYATASTPAKTTTTPPAT